MLPLILRLRRKVGSIDFARQARSIYALSGGTVTLRIYRNPLWKSDRKEGNAMDVFQFMQIVVFALAFFVAGYNLGKRK